jgi:hypothetical protein
MESKETSSAQMYWVTGIFIENFGTNIPKHVAKLAKPLLIV